MSKKRTIGEIENKPRRTEADVRDDHLKEGAILIEFTPHAEASKQVIEWWRGMEKYGFKVTDDGCIIPHKQYWGSKGGNEKKGKDTRPSCRSLSCQFFHNKRAKKQDPNEGGWPCDEQYSHLCHVWNCASPKCIHVEEQWKNLKRNYCGSTGKCECPFEPKCTRIYRNSEWDWDFNYLDYDTENLKSKIQAWMGNHEFKILPRDYYKVEDEKRRNRNLRKNRQKKQKK